MTTVAGERPAPAPRDGAVPHLITGPRRAWALTGVMLVQFISVLASTIVSNAAPTMADELQGVSLYAWVFGGYTLAATICVPVVGKLSDLFGRRIFYLIGLVLFLAGSVACALAQNMPELIAGRVVSGAGGGSMLALTGATLGDIFPPRDRAKWMGLIMTNYGIGSMLGPIVGGVITGHAGWRWTFVVPLPLGAIALVTMATVLPRIARPARPVIDWSGIALLTLGLVGALIALTVGGVSAPWSSPEVVVAVLTSVVLLAVFTVHELRTAAPVMSPDLFRSRVFLCAVSLSFLLRMVFFGMLTFFPIYLQGVLGQSPQQAGLQLLPIMGAFVVANVVSGQVISRSGRYRGSAVVGPVITLAGAVLAVTLTPTSGIAELYLAMALMGAGVGTIFPLASTVVQSAFAYRILGAANSARQFFDNLGQVIGISAMTTLMITVFSGDLAQRVPSAGVATAAIGSAGSHGLLSSKGQAQLSATLSRATGGDVAHASAVLHQSLAAGLRAAFIFAALAALLGLVVGVLLPEIPLRTTHE